jgi:hypothetical protein
MTFEEYIISVEKIVDKLLRLSQSLADMVKDANSKVKTMKSLLERLAPEDGLQVLDEYEHPVSCVFCGETSFEKEPGIWASVHDSDCPWVEARKLLEELK